MSDTDLPMPRDIPEADRMLGDARIVLAAQLTRGNTIGVGRIRRTIDRLLDARIALAGPPVCMSVPAGGSEACGRVKDTFGSGVYLCSSCDFRSCSNDCGRKVIALDVDVCHTCAA